MIHKRFGHLIFKCEKAVGEQSMIDSQRRSAFIYACLAMFLSDIALWFLGMNTIGLYLYESIHLVHLVMTLLLFVLYLWGKLPVLCGLSILCIANQLAILCEMFLCVASGTPLQTVLISCYMVLVGLNMTLVLLAYIRILPFALGALAILGYGVCCIVNDDRTLAWMFPIFCACFLVVSMLGHQLSRNVHRLEQEKSALKDDEQKVLNLFELDKSQLMAYISLAKEKGLSYEQSEALLNVIGKQARETIRHNVSYYYRQREIDYAGLRSRLPELTPSEIEICDLILKEKKLKEIVQMLGKSEGNITSQRTNIRRKLGLSSSENLHDTLAEIMKAE